jgi:hypothetical protein
MVMTSPVGGASATGASSAEQNASARTCANCGASIARRRRSARQNEQLCATCDQRERRAAYFRSYYEVHKDRILDKNRRWARDNKTRIVQLRQARRVRDLDTATIQRTCVDCETPVTRALRCRKCYIRFRYANDPAYRARRLATTRRWLEKRQGQGEGERSGRRAAARSAHLMAN